MLGPVIAATEGAPVERLPRGRHGLSRDEVVTSQRGRMLRAMAEAMTERGYVGTPVAEVIRRAGVSRETFYQQFSSKLDCFMAAFDEAAELLLGSIAAKTGLERTALDGRDGRDADTRVAQFDLVLRASLDALAAHPGYARVFLVDVYAAGLPAVERRARLQRRIVDSVAALLGATEPRARFGCEVLVAALASMVTVPLVANDAQAVRDLHGPVLDLVRHALVAGPY
jgi:AcrR family transcriptional regulator